MDICRDYLENQMTDEKYENYLESLINRKREKDVSLDEEVARNMGEITSFNYYFERREKEIEVLSELKGNRKRFLSWLRENVWNDKNLNQLTVQIVGLCEHSLKDVVGKDDEIIKKEIITEYSGDLVQDICLKSPNNCDEFILDFETFKNQNSFFKKQPPTIDL